MKCSVLVHSLGSRGLVCFTYIMGSSVAPASLLDEEGYVSQSPVTPAHSQPTYLIFSRMWTLRPSPNVAELQNQEPHKCCVKLLDLEMVSYSAKSADNAIRMASEDGERLGAITPKARTVP